MFRITPSANDTTGRGSVLRLPRATTLNATEAGHRSPDTEGNNHWRVDGDPGEVPVIGRDVGSARVRSSALFDGAVFIARTVPGAEILGLGK